LTVQLATGEIIHRNLLSFCRVLPVKSEAKTKLMIICLAYLKLYEMMFSIVIEEYGGLSEITNFVY